MQPGIPYHPNIYQQRLINEFIQLGRTREQAVFFEPIGNLGYSVFGLIVSF